MAERDPIPNQPHFKNRTGQRYGRWLVTRYLGAGQWLCECDCGSRRAVSTSSLRNGSTSCGCVGRAQIILRNIARRRHGMSHTRTHRVWSGMLERCGNPNNKDFARWGGRGITVCERWLVFENFFADMGQCPAGLTIDRTDNDGNYEPGNCRWVNQLAQQRNRRSNRILTIGGRSRCIAEWVAESGLKFCTVHRRLKLGWDPARAVSAPVRPRAR